MKNMMVKDFYTKMGFRKTKLINNRMKFKWKKNLKNF